MDCRITSSTFRLGMNKYKILVVKQDTIIKNLNTKTWNINIVVLFDFPLAIWFLGRFVIANSNIIRFVGFGSFKELTQGPKFGIHHPQSSRRSIKGHLTLRFDWFVFAELAEFPLSPPTQDQPHWEGHLSTVLQNKQM